MPKKRKTLVVHCRKQPYDVYIGRPLPWFKDDPRISKGSRFLNPFRIGAHGSRLAVIRRYRQYILKRLAEEPDLVQELAALKGKRLGCWCAPDECHGDVLAELADQLG